MINNTRTRTRFRVNPNPGIIVIKINIINKQSSNASIVRKRISARNTITNSTNVNITRSSNLPSINRNSTRRENPIRTQSNIYNSNNINSNRTSQRFRISSNSNPHINNTTSSNNNNNNNRRKTLSKFSNKKTTSSTNNNNSNINNQTNDTSKETSKIINLHIKVFSHQELQNVKSLYNEYKNKIEQYKKNTETFNTTLRNLAKQLNYTNNIVRELKDNITRILRFSSQNIISIIKKLTEYPALYISLTTEMNREITNQGQFKFNELMPIVSFNKGITFYEKMSDIMRKGIKKLKQLMVEVEEHQKNIIIDDAFPISDDKKYRIFDLMDLINFSDIGKGNLRDVVKEKNCVICFCNFKKNELVKLFSCRKHIFHENCIKQWIQNSFQCPLCKFSMKKDMIKYNMITFE